MGSVSNSVFAAFLKLLMFLPVMLGGCYDYDYPHTSDSETTGKPALSTFRLAAGSWHACVVTDSGGVKCWGLGSSGQLGDGGYTGSSTPVDVSGLTSGVATAVAGSSHTCVLTDSGGVKCWGYNNDGQLGDGTNDSKTTPVDVSGLTSGVVAVAAGNAHTCAVTDSGGVKCWGFNDNGQLGDGSNDSRTTPADVSGLTSGVVAVAAGSWHTCAVTNSGGVKCWGRNFYGQLGDGTNESKTTPTDVSGLTSGVVAVAGGGYHTCAVADSGGVMCWGYNNDGQLGDGATLLSSTPTDVSGLTSGVAAVATGFGHTCAVTDSGGVKCWGFNDNGQLGDGSNDSRTTPTDVSGLTSGVVAVATGGGYTCAVTNGGEVKCWGSNSHGQLGDGTNESKTTPTDVSGLP